MFRVELPEPSGEVPADLRRGIGDHRPALPGVARVHLKGWASQLTFDDRTYGGVGNDLRLQSPGYEGMPQGATTSRSMAVRATSRLRPQSAVNEPHALYYIARCGDQVLSRAARETKA